LVCRHGLSVACSVLPEAAEQAPQTGSKSQLVLAALQSSYDQLRHSVESQQESLVRFDADTTHGREALKRIQ